MLASYRTVQALPAGLLSQHGTQVEEAHYEGVHVCEGCRQQHSQQGEGKGAAAITQLTIPGV